MCASRGEEAVSRKPEATAAVTSLQIFSPFRERGESTQTRPRGVAQQFSTGEHVRSDTKNTVEQPTVLTPREGGVVISARLP
jgi:hypothetical protein